MIRYKHVILGGGMVAGYCAKEYTENGGRPGELAIISADDALPYERPPLSKGFLAGKDDEHSVLVNKPEFYRDHGIETKLDITVTTLDAGARRLRTDSGEEIGFEKLVIATGAEVRTLEVQGASSANVLYLRSLRDARSIRDLAMTARRALVIGGGFIAMEVGAVLAQRKLDTTIVVRDERIWQGFFTPEMSAFFENYYLQRGVNLIKRASVAAIENGGKVRLTDGQTLDSDVIVAGVGVRPVTALAEQAGLRIDNGIVVNEYLETSAADIFAAGDAANYPDAVFGNKRRRVEHWDNAVAQGQHVARALLGRREPYVHVPYFFSDVFDLSYEYWGDTSEAERMVHRGDLHTSSFSVWWLRGETLVAAFAMNRPDEERELAPELIRSKQKVSAEHLRGAASIRSAP